VSAPFDPSGIFATFDMKAVDTGTFDDQLNAPGDDLRCVFFWGKDCFNCDIFKKTALSQVEAIRALNLTWFHADVYADEPLGRRFGLHGVPAFFLFRNGKRLGRVTGWPGLGQFSAAIARLNAAYAAASDAAPAVAQVDAGTSGTAR
jgi:hypothetical protein